MLERSEKAMFSRAKFFQHVNDIDIYVEDTKVGFKKIFNNIFSRVFSGMYRVNQVFPIGSRAEVIKKWRNCQEKERPYLFVVDGDFYILGKDDEIKGDEVGIFRLERYSIENYFFCNKAIEVFLDEESPDLNADVLMRNFDMEGWLKQNVLLIEKIVSIYFLASQVIPEVPTVSFKVNNLLADRFGNLDEIKVEARFSDLKRKILDVIDEEKFNDMYEAVRCHLGETGCAHHFLSGKTYILPMLFVRMRSFVKTNSRNDNIQIRMAKNIDVECLRGCIDKVQRNS
tara:strand:- start:42210 stop:43064 length:855 start_codon:yes stop_codon:yes gene_type:complete